MFPYKKIQQKIKLFCKKKCYLTEDCAKPTSPFCSNLRSILTIWFNLFTIGHAVRTYMKRALI